MKRSTLAHPKRRTITVALLLLTLAGLLNGAIPARRGMAASHPKR